MGLDEREIESVTRRYAAIAKTAVDVGAHDGWYSLFFASQPNIRRVLAFEPDLAHHSRFNENLSANDGRFRKKVELSAKFVGRFDDADNVTLDRLLSDCLYPVVIKVDVDGGELEVLSGLRETLRRRRAMLIVETHSVRLEAQCLSFLETVGYRGMVIENAWYRALIRDVRPIAHNRWFSAEPSEGLSTT
jgi:hypothetical protein